MLSGTINFNDFISRTTFEIHQTIDIWCWIKIQGSLRMAFYDVHSKNFYLVNPATVSNIEVTIYNKSVLSDVLPIPTPEA